MFVTNFVVKFRLVFPAPPVKSVKASNEIHAPASVKVDPALPGPLSNPPTSPAHQRALSSSDASLSVPNNTYIHSSCAARRARADAAALCQIMSNSCQIQPTPRGPLSNLRQIRGRYTPAERAAPPNSAAARPSVKSRQCLDQCPSNFRPPSGPYYPPLGGTHASPTEHNGLTQVVNASSTSRGGSGQG